MKRLAALLLPLALLSCSDQDDIVKSTDTVLRYDRFVDYVSCNVTDSSCGGSHVTLEFKVIETGKKAHWELKSNDALHKLEWLQKGECYLNPLSELDHEQVPCG